jgi:hypothetical protein
VRVIEHVFYPDFPPDEHAGQLVAWLRKPGANRTAMTARHGPSVTELRLPHRGHSALSASPAMGLWPVVETVTSPGCVGASAAGANAGSRADACTSSLR